MLDDDTLALMIELREAARALCGAVEGLGMSPDDTDHDHSSSDLDVLNTGVERMHEAVFSWWARMHPSRGRPGRALVSLALVSD
jgi:hypothetical protein